MVEKRTTEELFTLFCQEENLDKALAKAAGDITNPTPHQYLNEQMAHQNVNIAEMAARTHLSRSFVYQIFEGARLPGRDVLLRMAFAMGLSADETRKLLAVFRRGTLYPRIQRDAILLHGLSHGQSLEEANRQLAEAGEEPLYKELPSDADHTP